MGKYESLPKFLGTATGRTQRMSFSEIERIVGFKLPKSAYRYEAWWANNPTGHSHSRAWIDAGWRTEAVDLSAHRVTFQRVTGNPNQDAPKVKSDPWGCMAGTVTFVPGVDLTEPSGEVWNAEEGKLLNE